MSSTSSEVIVLYDIPSNVQGKAWSPNTWKTRFALNYKGLPYRTIWVEYPDIARVCKEIGAAPTGTHADGTPSYTLPVIYDPSTKIFVADSGIIVRYLDKTYPDTPVLIPAETDAFHEAFQEAFLLTIQERFSPLLIPPTVTILYPRSAEYFRRTREITFGKKLEEIAPEGPLREQRWRALQGGFSKLTQWMSTGGHERPFFMGEKICHADLSIAGWLIWAKCAFGEDSSEWAAIKTWDGGKWARFMEYFEKYEVVDD